MKIDRQKIRECRLRRAWTQEQLAAVAGLGLRTVQRIERSGQASPESVQALAAVLDLSPAELFSPVRPARSLALPENEAEPVPVEWLPLAVAAADDGPAADEGLRRAERDGRYPSLARRRVLGFGAVMLSGFGGLFLGRAALAEQLQLDVDVTVDNRTVRTSRVLVESGQNAEISHDGLFRLELMPSVRDGMVLMRTRLFRYRDEEYVLVASPSLLMAEREPAEVHLGKGGFGEEAHTYWAVRVTASIQ